MKTPDHQDLESALCQLPWKVPSQRLDAAIEALRPAPKISAPEIQQRNGIPQPLHVTGRRFGWLALVSTAIAAGISGLLIGHSMHLAPSVASATSVSQNLDHATTQNNIVPVKFNANAFALLHQHSKRPEFSKCEDCHVSNRNRFENWFYGDAKFLEKNHGFKDCSDCHLVK